MKSTLADTGAFFVRIGTITEYCLFFAISGKGESQPLCWVLRLPDSICYTDNDNGYPKKGVGYDPLGLGKG